MTSTLDAAQANPESADPDVPAPADAQNLTDWIIESGTGQRFRRFDLGTAVLAAEHGVDIEVTVHGEQLDNGALDLYLVASQEVGAVCGINAADTRKLAHLLLQAADKIDASTATLTTPAHTDPWTDNGDGTQERWLRWPEHVTPSGETRISVHGMEYNDGRRDLGIRIRANDVGLDGTADLDTAEEARAAAVALLACASELDHLTKG